MISKEDLSRLLLAMEADRVEKTISKTDKNKFGKFSKYKRLSKSNFG